jgi:protein-disulfide isomerase
MTLHPPVNERDHSQGTSDAPITLVHYGDFECPYSAAARVAVKKAQDLLQGQVRYVFRPFPLFDIHPHALTAAEAAEAAAAQGKFWEMYDLLFVNQDHLEPKDLAYYAKHLGLELARFEKDMDEHRYLEAIQASIENGKRGGAHGTPTFFINGQFFDNRMGLWDVSTLLEAIETTLKQG